MAEATSPWSLFGVDLLAVAAPLRLGLRQLFWEPVGGVRQRIERPVRLVDPDGGSERLYSDAGPLDGTDADAPWLAMQVPERYVLTRTLELPSAVEVLCDEVVNLEIQAASPFPAEDTCSGWRVVDRSDGHIRLTVVVAAKSDVVHLMRQIVDQDAMSRCEAWYLGESGLPIVFRGFGESIRQQAYRRSLKRLGSGLLVALAALVLAAAVPAVATSMRSERYEAMFAEARAAATDELALRESLAGNNAVLSAVEALIADRPSYLQVLNRLAEITDDDTYLTSLEIDGRTLRMMGFSGDAASYMQVLARQDWLEGVMAPVAFQRDRRSDAERFTIDAQIRVGVAPAGSSPLADGVSVTAGGDD